MKTSIGTNLISSGIVILVIAYGISQLTGAEEVTDSTPKQEKKSGVIDIKTLEKQRKSLLSLPTHLRPDKARINDTVAHKQDKGPPIPEECEDIWYTITDSPLEELEAMMVQKELPMNPSCRKTEDKLFGRFALPDDCLVGDLEIILEDGTKMSDSCSGVLLVYRSIIVDYLSEGKDPKNLSSQVLINKILARLSTNMVTKDFAYTISLTDILAAKEPESYAARKSQIFVRHLNYMMVQPRNEKLVEEIQNLSKEIEVFGRDDSDIFEMSLIIPIVKKDFELLQTKINVVADKYPDSPIPDYYQSAYYWYTGDKELAIESAEKAISKGPDVAKYKETLKNLMVNPVKTEGMYNCYIGIFLGDTSVY